MVILSVRHKALRQFLETGNSKGLDARVTGRLRNMVALLNAATDADELKVPPNFGFHWLTGDRSGTASITVTNNWRLTFRLNAENEIVDLDLEDYH
jgi:proteic killer suppression protein